MSVIGPPVLRGLFDRLIDYAGLFPPASLALREVVRRCASYRQGPWAWMLGRLVVPARQLDELAALGPWSTDAATPWLVAAVAGADAAEDLARVRAFNERCAPFARVDVFEARVSTADDVTRLAASCAAHVRLACEVPQPTGIAGILDAVAAAGAAAKLRAGGVVANAFPSAGAVASFLRETARRGLPIKATAGLHHPIRGDFRLTYEADAPRTTMHGFLNMLCAAACAVDLRPEETLIALLEHRDTARLRVSASGLAWNGETIDATTLARARSASVLAIGSCSFEEPVAELQQLGLI